MKKIIKYALLISVTSVLSVFIYSELAGNSSSNDQEVIQTKLFSRILNEERNLIIRLPKEYDSSRHYPVMYVLDGGSQDQHTAEKFDVLSTAGYVPPTIIVGIPNMSGENRELNLTPPFMRIDNDNTDSELGEADKFLTFMETELFPFMEKSYPVSPLRLISGNSRGGLLVMYSLLHNPDLFQARFCYSTPFWRQDNILVTKVSAFLQARDTLNTFIYLSAGQNETENIKNGLSKMTATLRDKAPVGLTIYSDYTPSAIHQDNAIRSAAKGIARWGEYIKRETGIKLRE